MVGLHYVPTTYADDKKLGKMDNVFRVENGPIRWNVVADTNTRHFNGE